MRDSRVADVVGTLVGLGAIAGVAAVVLIARRKPSRGTPREPGVPQPSTLPPTVVEPEAHGPRGKFPPLVERWRGEVARRASGMPIDGLLEWIRIESGGDTCSIGGPTEVGIWQLNFPDDAKYGATLEGLRAICQKSHAHNPADISWLSEKELDEEVGSGIRKVLAAREIVRRVFAVAGMHWPESSFDFGSAVKQIHATPAVITEMLPKMVAKGGAPASWNELRDRVRSFPVDQMGPGLQRLARAPSKYGLKNRLEDTLRNAEFVGRAWAV